MASMQAIASGVPPGEIGELYVCQALRVGSRMCQCRSCAAAGMTERGYRESHGAVLRRVIAAHHDTILTNGAAGAVDGAQAFEQDGRLMIFYTLPCGRTGAISTEMKFVRHHERSAWLVAHVRIANRDLARRTQSRTTARDRGTRSTTRSACSTRSTRTASSAASGSSSPSPDGPGSSRSGTHSALAESDPDPDGVRVSHTWRPRALSGLPAGAMRGEGS